MEWKWDIDEIMIAAVVLETIVGNI